MGPSESDEDFFVVVEREQFTCMAGDIMDWMQLVHQFLLSQIQPLQQDMIVIGRAIPVLSGLPKAAKYCREDHKHYENWPWTLSSYAIA